MPAVVRERERSSTRSVGTGAFMTDADMGLESAR